jgi:hypothetical protein
MSSGSVATVVGGHDAGMGVKTVGEAYVNRSGTLVNVHDSSGCSGSGDNPCSAGLAAPLPVNADDLTRRRRPPAELRHRCPRQDRRGHRLHRQGGP